MEDSPFLKQDRVKKAQPTSLLASYMLLKKLFLKITSKLLGLPLLSFFMTTIFINTTSFITIFYVWSSVLLLSPPESPCCFIADALPEGTGFQNP
jgi:hypothetical protein